MSRSALTSCAIKKFLKLINPENTSPCENPPPFVENLGDLLIY